MPLDTETEIIASVDNAEALIVYYNNGVNEGQFADPKMQEIYKFAIEYLFNYGGMRTAPSKTVLRNRFPEYDDLTREAEGGQAAWLAKKLKDDYCARQVRMAVTEQLPGMNEDAEEKVKYFRDTLSVITDNVTPRSQKFEYGVDMEAYELAANADLQSIGAPYPFEIMNQQTSGIKPGELAILAAPTKKGKSWFAAKTALEAVRQGWNVYLASLELSILQMTKRIELMETNKNGIRIPADRFLGGEEMPSFIEILSQTRRQIADFPGRLIVEKLGMDERSPSEIIQRAKLNGCNYIIVDQLSFMNDKSIYARDKYQMIGELANKTKLLLDSPTDNVRMPMLLLHQINREGTKNSQKTGLATISDLASSAEIERVSDIIWTIGQTDEEKNNNIMKLATLASRRTPNLGYRLFWELRYSANIEMKVNANGDPQLLVT